MLICLEAALSIKPNPILRDVLDECLNVWLNEDWENLELYHMKYNGTKNY